MKVILQLIVWMTLTLLAGSAFGGESPPLIPDQVTRLLQSDASMTVGKVTEYDPGQKGVTRIESVSRTRIKGESYGESSGAAKGDLLKILSDPTIYSRTGLPKESAPLYMIWVSGTFESVILTVEKDNLSIQYNEKDGAATHLEGMRGVRKGLSPAGAAQLLAWADAQNRLPAYIQAPRISPPEFAQRPIELGAKDNLMKILLEDPGAE